MYDAHYGLTGRPFQLTPDPAFWFDTATHRKAMAYLGYGLSQGEGFIVITGEVGAGKTTLVGHLMATIDSERLNVIRLVTTQIEADDLLRLVADGLGVDHGGLTKAQLLNAIERGLHAVARSGRRTLLIVDEAQSLPVGAIEELRMLSNFQAGGYALLQIFLLGQPEFRQRLHGSDRLEQLRQRVIAMHHLEPMGAEEVEPYLAHRLGVVGWNGRPDFTSEAVLALHRWSGGVPRRLNQLMSRVLLHGAIEGIDRFDRSDIERVIADLDGDGMGMGERAPASAPLPHADVRHFEPIRSAEPAGSPKPIAPAPLAEAPRAPVVEAEAADADPMPMTPPPPPAPTSARPIRLAAVPDVPPPEPAVQAVPEPAAAREDDDAATPSIAAIEARLHAIEARLDEQDAALRRVLTLLVDWVEGDAARPNLAPLRDGTRG